MKELFILRHGQTDLNLKGMVQGRGVDSSLNDHGRLQAKQVFEALDHENFDLIYTSSLKRTHETVKFFSAKKKSLRGFDEISWGALEGVVPSEKLKSAYLDTINKWKGGDLDANLAGGETPNEVVRRQKDAIEVVLKSEAKKILICMHGRAMRILLSWLLNYPLSMMDNFIHQNACYYKLTLLDGQFRMDEFCVTDHLNPSSSD